MLKEIKIKLYNLLRWSQQYLKTDMVYLAKGGFWLTLGQIVSSASSFLLTLAFANLIPKETYGTYKYILSIAGILTIPTLQGMGTAITQAVARGYEGSLIPALKTKIRWGLLGGLTSLILAVYYYFQSNATLAISFLVSAAFLPIMDSFAIYDSLLQGKKLFDVSTKYFIISQIISVISLIAAIFFTKNLFLILLTYFLPWTVTRFVFLKITLKKFLSNQQTDPQTISYGKHLSFMGIIPMIADRIDGFILFQFLGPTQLAIYSFAIAIPEQIKAVLKSISPLSMPRFAERPLEEIKKTIWRRILAFGIVLTFIITVYFIFAPLIYKILFPAYLESIKFSQIFSMSLLAAIGVPIVSILQAHKKTKELYLLITVNSLILIASLLIGTYLWDLWGAIGAYVFMRFISFILTLILLMNIK